MNNNMKLLTHLAAFIIASAGCSNSYLAGADPGELFAVDAGYAPELDTGGMFVGTGTGGMLDTGGAFLATGGTFETSGGSVATGGIVVPETGGNSVSTGGDAATGGVAVVETGGAVATGGDVVATGGMIPCLDSDADGVCDDADTCPGMSDDDADANGYADACDQVLWRVEMNWDNFNPPSTATSAIVSLANQFGDNTSFPSSAYQSPNFSVSHDASFALSESVAPIDVLLRDNAGKLGVYLSPGNYAAETAGWANYPVPLGTVTRHYYRAEYDATAHTIFAFWEIRGY